MNEPYIINHLWYAGQHDVLDARRGNERLGDWLDRHCQNSLVIAGMISNKIHAMFTTGAVFATLGFFTDEDDIFLLIKYDEEDSQIKLSPARFMTDEAPPEPKAEGTPTMQTHNRTIELPSRRDEITMADMDRMLTLGAYIRDLIKIHCPGRGEACYEETASSILCATDGMWICNGRPAAYRVTFELPAQKESTLTQLEIWIRTNEKGRRTIEVAVQTTEVHP